MDNSQLIEAIVKVAYNLNDSWKRKLDHIKKEKADIEATKNEIAKRESNLEHERVALNQIGQEIDTTRKTYQSLTGRSLILEDE
jgi:hypothetical protein